MGRELRVFEFKKNSMKIGKGALNFELITVVSCMHCFLNAFHFLSLNENGTD